MFFLFFTTLMITSYSYSETENRNKKHSLIFFLDNDLFYGTDEHYTNGAKLTWLFPEIKIFEDSQFLPNWMKRFAKKLPSAKDEIYRRNISLSLGQHMYTPVDYSVKELIKEDRPYAGFLYLELALHSKNSHNMKTFSLTGGVVGPSSIADKTQRFVHKVRELEMPQGWDNQIKNEPVLQFGYQQKLRLYEKDYNKSFGFDIIPSWELLAGNAFLALSGGSEFRIGFNLPNDFGTAFNRPNSGVTVPLGAENQEGNSDCGFFVSAGGNVYCVGRNIFLDGNTFKESHSVKKRNVVMEAGVGATFYYKHVKLTYSHVYRSKEFDKQKDRSQRYGAINITLIF